MRKKLILASMLVSAQLLCAQQSKDYTQADKLFHEGKALYDQGHFKAAYERLNEYFLTLDMKDRSPRYIETEYYIEREGTYHSGCATAVCAYADEFRGTAPAYSLTIK